jgi:hypothetical protein
MIQTICLWESAYKIAIDMADGKRAVDLNGNSFSDKCIAKATRDTQVVKGAQLSETESNGFIISYLRIFCCPFIHPMETLAAATQAPLPPRRLPRRLQRALLGKLQGLGRRFLIRPFCITILYHNLLLFIDISHI